MAAGERGGGAERRSGDGGSTGGAGKIGAEAGRDSSAAGAAEEVGIEEAVADRCGQPIFAAAARLRAGVHGDGGGERRLFDRGAAGESGEHGQRTAGADGGTSGAGVWRAAATGERGQRIFHARECAGDGGTRAGCVCAGFASGARIESGEASAGARSGARSGAAADETKAALSGRAGDLPKTEGNRGTKDRNIERATRDAAVPDARTGQGGDRVHASEHGVESAPPVAQSSGAGWRRVGSRRASRHPVCRASWDQTRKFV